jgi:YegS/Rv2252/BmrU family lipid kinase
MRKVCFILNPVAKSAKATHNAILESFGKGPEILIKTSDRSGHVIQLATDAVAEGCTHILIAGGDGSLNEGVNGLMNAVRSSTDLSIPVEDRFDKEALSRISLGVIPIGSGNDFSKSARVSSDLTALREMIEKDEFNMVDLGWTRFQNPSGQQTDRFFMNITDTGMGGAVALGLQNGGRWKWLGPGLSYARAIISTFLTYKKSPVRCHNADFEWEGNIMNLILANGKYFGSGMGIAPEAEWDSGEFSLVILGDITLLDYFKELPKVKKCRKLDHKQVHYFTVKDLSVESMAAPLPIDMDGEFIGYTPMYLKKYKRWIRFISPAR